MPTTFGTIRVPASVPAIVSTVPSESVPRKDREIAVQRALGLDDESGLDAALLGEQRRVHVRHVLAHDVRENALERRETVAR